MSRMFNPPHSGEVLKDGVMVEGVTVTGFPISSYRLIT